MKTPVPTHRLLTVVALILIAFIGSIHAAEVVVTKTTDSGPGSLRQAIAGAKPGDTITFSLPPNSSITLTSDELLINKNLTIEGPGANLLTVQRSTADGTPNFRIFNIASDNVTISGLTIARGYFYTGGGIYNSGGNVTVTNCTVSGNSKAPFQGSGGGGIFNAGAMTISNSTISGNTIPEEMNTDFSNGGGVSNSGTLTITNSTISGNTAVRAGGGIINNGTMTVANSTISGNTGKEGGGIWAVFADKTHIRNTIIALNTAPEGPDVFVALTSDGFNFIGNNKDATITATTGDQIGTEAAPKDPKLGPLQDNGGPTKTHALLFSSNAISPAIDGGDSGGSNTDQRGLPRPVDDPGIDNASGGDGSDIGAYEVQADVLPGCSTISGIVHNNNDSGTESLRAVIANVCAGSTITFAANVRGAINLTSAELSITKSLTINGPGANLLSVQRGASAGNFRIFDISGNVNAAITGLTIAKGNVPGANFGGGLSNSGTLTLSNVAVSGNSAGFGGGGISNNGGTLTVRNSTISGNSTGLGGGGITGGTVYVINSTISNNSTMGNAGGIAATTVVLTNSTIAGNSAGGMGGGIFNNGANGATVTSRNSIIATNTATKGGPDVNGSLTSQGFNLIGNNSGANITQPAGTIGDQIGTPGGIIDPMLGDLLNNGGPTKTLALLSGSKAIDKGHSSGLAIDQRGFTRPVGSSKVKGGNGSDIGAFEVQAAPPTPTPKPTPTPTATPGLIANVSTRLPVGTGDNVLIEGFIVLGPTGSTKKIIVRAIGPSLVPFGIPDALANPTLEIHNASKATIATNNDWKTTQVGGIITGNQFAEINESGVAPSNNLESAIIANLAPGDYTAVVRGAGNSVGTGVVDAYDLSPGSSARLVNFATRGLIQPGDKLMIAGFIIQKGPVRAVVRAIGPSLSAFGITNALPDTTLQLRDQNGAVVRENDDWKTDPAQKQELESVGLQPSDNLEAALVETIPPGQYTAQVRGKGQASGIGVVQVFFIQ